MEYLDYTITFDNSDKNRVYRLESKHQTCWMDNFRNAVLFVQCVWLQTHFRVGLKWVEKGTPQGCYHILSHIIGDIAVFKTWKDGRMRLDSMPKILLQKRLLRHNIGLRLL